jgi:DNA-binding NarL/FixJ family response regulator
MIPSTATILLVEDDKLNQYALRTLFEDTGHTLVGMAETAQQALTLAERYRPTHVVLDVRIKGPMDGIQTAAELMKHYVCQIIFVTGDTHPDTLVRMDAVTLSHVLFKPVSPEVLINLIALTQ